MKALILFLCLAVAAMGQTGSGQVAVVTPATSGGGGTGTVTSVSVVTANGISGSVATATTTPAITLSFPNAVTAAAVAASSGLFWLSNGADRSAVASDTVTTANLTTANVTNFTYGSTTFTGVTGTGKIVADTAPQISTIELGAASDTTLARSSAGNMSIEGNVVYRAGGTDVAVADGGTGLSSGTSGGVLAFTASGTIASSAALTANALVIGGGAGAVPLTTTTGTGVLTALGINVGSAGAFVALNGAGGTPSSLTLTNATGLPVAGITSSTSTALGVGSLELGAASDTTLSRSAAGVLSVEGSNVFASNTKTDVVQGAQLVTLSSSSTDTYVGTAGVAITGYVTGTHYTFVSNTANTGAASLNINAIGAKTIVKVAGGITTTLADNDIRSGQVVDVVYDGTNLQLQSTLGNAASGGSLTSTYVGYGDGSNLLTGEAAFAYNATTNIATIGGISLGAGSEASSIGPLVDSVDGTTPLNNIVETVAAGTAYTLTTSYAALDFGTTDPVVVLPNAGTYTLYCVVQTALVSATTTTQSAQFKLRRTNNTAADLGEIYGQPLPVATIGTEGGPSLSIVAVKYTTTNTNDSITIFGQISASLGAGTVTTSTARITAIRAY